MANEKNEKLAFNQADKSALDKPTLDLDPWAHLKTFTRARIALGRVGSSLPTKEVLDFGLAHAMARDAVHLPLDTQTLANQIESLGFSTIQLHSRAPDRANYLLRPDWGRRLNAESLAALKLSTVKLSTPQSATHEENNQSNTQSAVDLMIVIGDGLSSLAISNHAVPLLAAMQPLTPANWQLGKVAIVSQARVAIADEIGAACHARLTVMLIGERPGLSSPDSLGIYITYAPQLSFNDANRNCISNVRPQGLNYVAAAKKMMWLVKEAMRLQISGVALKDESDAVQIEVQQAPQIN